LTASNVFRTAKVLLAAAALLAVCAPPGAAAGETLARVKRTGVLQDVLVDDYPPFGFIDDRNQLAGFDVDVAQAVANKLGVKLKLSTPGWETISAGRWHGRWDVCICSMSPTQERARVLDFPAQYYFSPAVLVVNSRDSRIRSIADISGKRVGVGTGSSYESYLHRALEIPGGQPISYPFHDVLAIPGDETVNFRNLSLGPGVRLDAIVSDLATARGHVRSVSSLKIVPGTLYSEPNVIATDKGDAEWNNAIAGAIAQLKGDGTLAAISRKWLDTDLTHDDR
jgi:polar amino acid transport system substrate-binding protein